MLILSGLGGVVLSAKGSEGSYSSRGVGGSSSSNSFRLKMKTPTEPESTTQPRSAKDGCRVGETLSSLSVHGGVMLHGGSVPQLQSNPDPENSVYPLERHPTVVSAQHVPASSARDTTCPGSMGCQNGTRVRHRSPISTLPQISPISLGTYQAKKQTSSVVGKAYRGNKHPPLTTKVLTSDPKTCPGYETQHRNFTSSCRVTMWKRCGKSPWP